MSQLTYRDIEFANKPPPLLKKETADERKGHFTPAGGATPIKSEHPMGAKPVFVYVYVYVFCVCACVFTNMG